MFYNEFNDKVYKFEEDLNYLKRTGELDKTKDNMLNFANFFDQKVLVKSPDKSAGIEFKDEIVNKNPDASRYLDDYFLNSFSRFRDELHKEEPSTEKIIQEGMEILQRLRAFTKISSSSSY